MSLVQHSNQNEMQTLDLAERKRRRDESRARIDALTLEDWRYVQRAISAYGWETFIEDQVEFHVAQRHGSVAVIAKKRWTDFARKLPIAHAVVNDDDDAGKSGQSRSTSVIHGESRQS
jgi:hypothetical protein